jgi:hypothetical protein
MTTVHGGAITEADPRGSGDALLRRDSRHSRRAWCQIGRGEDASCDDPRHAVGRAVDAGHCRNWAPSRRGHIWLSIGG